MNDQEALPTVRAFPSEYRTSGLFLQATSLPSPHGIGDLSPLSLAFDGLLAVEDWDFQSPADLWTTMLWSRSKCRS